MTRINQIIQHAGAWISADHGKRKRLLTKVVLASLALCPVAAAQIWGDIPPTWTYHASMPYRYFHGAATGPDGKVYVVGGVAPWFNDMNGQTTYVATNQVVRYDPLKDTWTSVASMSTTRANHATVTGCDGKIYAIGGLDYLANKLATVEAYDKDLNQWTPQPSLTIPRAHLVAAVGGDCKIYAITNDPGIDTSANQVEILDGKWTSSGQWIYTQWTVGAPLPICPECSLYGNFGTPFIYAAVSAHTGHIYALADGTEFEFDGATWHDRGLNPKPNTFLGAGLPAAATLGGDGVMYVMDGTNLYTVSPPSLFLPKPTSMPTVFGGFAAATAEGRQFVLDLQTVASYGPIPAVLFSTRNHWRFDGSVASVTGCSTRGTGKPYVYLPGRVGQALSLDQNSPVYARNLFAASGCTDIGTQDFSIAFWMNPNGPASSVQSILDKRSQDKAGYHGYHVYFNNGKIGLQLADPTGVYVNYSSSVSIPKGQWAHVAITVSRSTIGRIWVNGVMAGQFAPTNLSLTTPVELNIGGHNFGGAGFDGQLDELIMYNYALNWPQLRSIFLAGGQGTL